MTEHYFNALEQKIDQMIQRCDQLERDNAKLREREQLLKEERAQLIHTNEQTQSKIKAMIMRLKALEQGK
ncbi:TIGR02449 family protein [uncultured Neptuniibacter sp.]|uniref:TIGR02449 family protein n=1 Tax=uncultured Neptuniibacter sp. TaxID=502143 RepID=UPI0026142A0F|nr:TIGR02449 family protein [uncultured Neptuniibacter sp.]